MRYRYRRTISIVFLNIRFGILLPPRAFLGGAYYIAFLILFLVIGSIIKAFRYAIISLILVRLASTGGGKNIYISSSALGPGLLISSLFEPSFSGSK